MSFGKWGVDFPGFTILFFGFWDQKKTEKWSHKTTHQPRHWNGFAAKSFHQAIAPTAMAMQHLGI
jgi:hypothetical protein